MQPLLVKLALLVKQLTVLIATLSTLSVPAAHFGASLPPNVAATTTLPAQTGLLPYFQSFDNGAGVYTLASTTIAQNTNNISVSTSSPYGLLNIASSSGMNLFTFGANGAFVAGASGTPAVGCLGWVLPGSSTLVFLTVSTQTAVISNTTTTSWNIGVGATTTAPAKCN